MIGMQDTGRHWLIDPETPRGGNLGPPAGALIATGLAVGGREASGVGRFIASPDEGAAFAEGEVLLAEFTTPAWLPIIEKAAALVIGQGDRRGYAARAARRLGLPAVIGARDAASRLWSGAHVTVCCGPDGVGRMYQTVELSRPTQLEASAAAKPV